MTRQIAADLRPPGRTHGVRLWARGLAALLLTLALAGCSANANPQSAGSGQQGDAEVEQLRSTQVELQAQLAQLTDESDQLRSEKEHLLTQMAAMSTALAAAKAGKPIPADLVKAVYFNDKADGDPRVYRKVVQADLNGDGQEENITVVTTAGADPQTGEFGWDDGHPWYVYVDEADGTRTTVFADWVQLGKLRVVVGEEPKSLIIASEQGAGTTIYRVTYNGPRQTEAVELISFLTGMHATFPPGSNFVE